MPGLPDSKQAAEPEAVAAVNEGLDTADEDIVALSADDIADGGKHGDEESDLKNFLQDWTDDGRNAPWFKQSAPLRLVTPKPFSTFNGRCEGGS